MTAARAGLIAGGVTLALGGAMWMGLTRKSTASPAPAAREAPQDSTHEKAALEEQLKKKPGHAPVLLRLAQLEFEGGHPAEARKRLEELLKAEPENLEARLDLGRAAYETGDFTAALAETHKILDVKPDHVDALYNLGAICANMGQADKAREYWSRAVRSAPDSESGKKAASSLLQLPR